MCGRYSLTVDQEALSAALGVEGLLHPRPRYNIAPTQEVPVLWREGAATEATVQRWGLVPSWSEGPGGRAPLINARSETAHARPSFRGPFARSRCLVPADGFFEWKPEEGGKIPFWIHREDRSVFTFAGLSDRWHSPDGGTLDSFAILTTHATGILRSIHDRMPVVLEPGDRAAWLDPDTPIGTLRHLLGRAPGQALVPTEVSTRVNRPAHDDPACILPVDPPGSDPPPPEQTSLF